MKFGIFVLLFVFCYVECRKSYVPIDKNANTAFINMEMGGVRAGGNPSPPNPGPVPPTATPKPANVVPPSPVTTVKPAIPTIVNVPTTTKTVQPPQSPTQIKPVPVNPPPVTRPITTPGPGTVKQLVNFYDSQGKASPIRPYSYSQAVKQG